MESLPISPQCWAALLKKTGREWLLFAGLGGLFAVVAFFEPFNTEKPFSHQTQDKVVRDYLSLPERLGYAILLRSGYAKAQLRDLDNGEIVTQAQQKDRTNVKLELEMVDSHPELACLRPEYAVAVAGIGTIDIHNLTIAILAAEKYNRSAFERRFEIGLAEFLLGASGRIPDFSYGIAQMRPEVAKRVLRAELGEFSLPDSDLLALLGNACQSARLASQYLEMLIGQEHTAKTLDELIAKLAQAYNGAVTPTIQGLRYADAVAGAYGLIPSNVADQSAETADAGLDLHCFTYAPGEVMPWDKDAPNSLLPGSGQGAAAPDVAKPAIPLAERDVQLKFLTTDPGPPAYKHVLADRRKQWLVEQLAALGFNRQRFSIADIESERPRPSSCIESESGGDPEPSVEIGISKPVSPPPLAQPSP